MVFFSLLSVLIAYKETSRVRPLRIKEGGQFFTEIRLYTK